jgi:hypothetical protein
LEATVLTRIPTLLLLLLFATQLQTSLLRTFRSACNPYGWYFSISSKWVPARTFWAIFYTSQYHHAILQSDLLVINIFLPSRVSTHREFLMLTLCMQAAHVSPDLEQRKNPSCKELPLNSLTSVKRLVSLSLSRLYSLHWSSSKETIVGVNGDK